MKVLEEGNRAEASNYLLVFFCLVTSCAKKRTGNPNKTTRFNLSSIRQMFMSSMHASKLIR